MTVWSDKWSRWFTTPEFGGSSSADDKTNILNAHEIVRYMAPQSCKTLLKVEDANVRFLAGLELTAADNLLAAQLNLGIEGSELVFRTSSGSLWPEQSDGVWMNPQARETTPSPESVSCGGGGRDWTPFDKPPHEFPFAQGEVEVHSARSV